MGTIYILLIISFISFIESTPLNQIQDDNDDYRLPTNVGDIKYSLTLEFPEETFTGDGDTFTGSIAISFKIVNDVQELKFHVSPDFITIDSFKFKNYDLIQTNGYSINNATNILTILNLDAMGGLKKGYQYTININYQGKISTSDAHGIYRRSYKNSLNETRHLITTQFEPYHARKAFPCFDEPAFKGTFDISFKIPSNLDLTILSNTETKKINDGITTFETTPVMSSYLLAFVISEFTSTSGDFIEGTKIPYKLWSSPDTVSYRDYAVDIGPKILKTLNSYMNRQYGSDLSKIDQVAVPDFGSGAMENWGLVIYSERLLLWNEKESSNIDKQNVATTIAHELAHQWFGNLITCDWWSVTFLNEGFATYFEYFTASEVETDWELDKQFVVNVLQPVMEVDAWEYSKALESETNTQSEISDKFGTISYYKGGSIIRMVSHIMNQDNFKAGIQSYVNNEQLQHATSIPSKLWAILQENINSTYSQFPEDTVLGDIMQNWVQKPGYPLLTVSLENVDIVISQERFLYDGSDTTTKWYIPVFLDIPNYPTPQQFFWLIPRQSKIRIARKEREGEINWVLLNNLQAGYYRVKYDDNIWMLISKALSQKDFDGISDLSRSNIVDDLFNLARANRLSYSTVFSRIQFLENDVSYFSWVPAFKGFNYINQKVSDGTDLKEAVKKHILSLIVALYKSAPLTLDDNKATHIQILTKTLASSWACGLGEEGCLNDARSIFDKYKNNNEVPERNIRSVVYCNALRFSKDTDDYDFMWKAYNNANSETEKVTILTALGCTSNEDKLKGYLEETIKGTDESTIQFQDVFTVFSAVETGSLKGVDLALNFFQDNYDKITEKYSPLNYQGKLLKGIAEKLITQEQINKLKNIITSHDVYSGDLKDAADEALASANSNLDWIKKHEADLRNYYRLPAKGAANSLNTNIFMIILLISITVLNKL